jgi:hypothetical protein
MTAPLVARRRDCDWIAVRTEYFHRQRLGAACQPAMGQSVYRWPASADAFRRHCLDAATFLAASLTSPGSPTQANSVPPSMRQFAERAGMLALVTLVDGVFAEGNGVSATRTAIYAGWQLVRWEGGRPMAGAAQVSDSTARAIDDLIGDVRKGLPANAPWEHVSAQMNWRQVGSVLRDLFVRHSSCSRRTPRSIMCDKVCHSCGTLPKDPQPPA